MIFVLVRCDGRPVSGGSPPGGLATLVQGAESNECFEGSVDTVALDVAMKEAHNLRLRQCAAGGVNGFANTVGDGISGGHAEEEGGTGVAVIPYGEGSLEVRQGDDGGGIERRVDGAETQDLGLGTTGGGAAHTGTKLAQAGIAILPKLAGRSVATEEDFGSRGGPIEGAAELAGDRG
jgi:hypothetical protein